MDIEKLYQRYTDLQNYLSWSSQDVERIAQIRPKLQPYFNAIVDDFYTEIEKRPTVSKVIVGGPAQVRRLKGTLLNWIEQLFQGSYDREYVRRRWQVGKRHSEIGLDQIYAHAALSRVRHRLHQYLAASWQDSLEEFAEALQSLNRLLDLDLTIIEDAYHEEYLVRQKQIERLALLGQMAGGIAHELRNPLNVIRTSTDLSLLKRDQHIERIIRQVNVADQVVTALSDFARLPLPEFKPLLVSSLFEALLAEADIPQNISVDFHGDPTLPPVSGDRRQLLIVLSNLIRNAIEAMPQGGILSVRAEQKAEFVEIRLADTGRGICHDDSFLDVVVAGLPRMIMPYYKL